MTTAMLVAAAIGLGAWLLWGERGCPTTTETQARKHNLLKAFRRDELSEISVESSASSFRLVRQMGKGDAADIQYFL